MHCLVTIYHPYLLPEIVARVTTFQEHLILLLPTKPEKPCTAMVTWHFTTPKVSLADQWPLWLPQRRSKMANLTSFNILFLTDHDDTCELMVEILSSWIKGQDFSLINTKYFSFTPYQ